MISIRVCIVNTRLVRPEARNNAQVVLQVEGFDVDSGVSDQPMGDEETLTGVKARAKGCYAAYRKKCGSFPHLLSVGLEGGLEWSPDKGSFCGASWLG